MRKPDAIVKKDKAVPCPTCHRRTYILLEYEFPLEKVQRCPACDYNARAEEMEQLELSLEV